MFFVDVVMYDTCEPCLFGFRSAKSSSRDYHPFCLVTLDSHDEVVDHIGGSNCSCSTAECQHAECQHQLQDERLPSSWRIPPWVVQRCEFQGQVSRLLSCRCSRVASGKQHHRAVCQILQAVRWLCHLNGSSPDGLGSTFSWLLESRILSQWTSRNRRSWNWSVEVCWMWTRSECRLHRVTGETFVVTPPNTERSLELDHRLSAIKAGGERCCLCSDGGASGTLQCANHGHGPSTHHHY